MEEIMDFKNLIKDLFSFSYENEYDDSEKDKFAENFKELLFAEDDDVKEFVKKWISDSIEIAREFGLYDDETEESGEETGEESDEGEDIDDVGEEAVDDVEVGGEMEEPKETEEESVSVEDSKKEEEPKVEQKVTTEQIWVKRANRYLI